MKRKNRHLVVPVASVTLVLAIISPPGLRLWNHPVAAASSSVHYKIDAAKSSFIVRVYRTGLFRALGHNHTIAIRDFTGTLQFTPGIAAGSSLDITARSNSLALQDDVSKSDREQIEKNMKDNVLEVGKYPEIIFKSIHIAGKKTGQNQYQGNITGNLSLHGVTRTLIIPTRVTVSPQSLRAQGEFAINQTDYSIKPVSVAGGTIKVKNEIKLSFDIIAH
jgi:polyisoprenoid-binding protein YceI